MRNRHKEELKEIAKKFCEEIEAEYVCCSLTLFRFISVNGNWYKIYWDDYRKLKDDPVWKNSWREK